MGRRHEAVVQYSRRAAHIRQISQGLQSLSTLLYVDRRHNDLYQRQTSVIFLLRRGHQLNVLQTY